MIDESNASRDSLFSLQGKVCLLTGATGHLGTSMARGLASAGADLALVSRTPAKATALAEEVSAAWGVRASCFIHDLSDSNATRLLPHRVVDEFGRLDCVINNAFLASTGSIEDVSRDEWARGIQGSITPALDLIQGSLTFLEESNGCIINVASMYGMVAPDPDLYVDTPFGSPVAYGPGKASLLQLTRYAASYLGIRGIRVNAISPGPFPKPEVQKEQAFTARLSARTMLKRIGMPEELQGAVVFLASDAASFITGHNLVVDGGWTQR